MPKKRRNNNNKKKNSKASEIEKKEENINWSTVDIDNLIEENIIEGILSNRASTRETAIKKLIKALSLKYCYDVVYTNIHSLTQALSKSLKKSHSTTEYNLALHALSLVCITLGADSDCLLTEFSSNLKTVIKDTHMDSQSRSDAVKCLSLLYFIGEADDLFEMCEFLEEILFSDCKKTRDEEDEEEAKGEDEVRNGEDGDEDKEIFKTGVLLSWLLIQTILPFAYFKRKSVQTLRYLLHDLKSCSCSANYKLLVSESFALIFNVLQQHAEANNEEYGLDKFSAFIGVKNLLETIKEHVTLNKKNNNNASVTNNNTSKKIQKRTLKNVLSTLEFGTPPVIEINIQNINIEFSSWVSITQLEFLKSILLEGLQKHFEDNTLLAEIFAFDFDVDDRNSILSKQEKRVLRGPNSVSNKERTKSRAKDRDIHGRNQSALFLDG